MPQIDNHNIVEQTREEIRQSDEDDRGKIQDIEMAQVKELQADLQRHCQQNEDHDKVSDEKLDRLMPLTDLIDPMKKIVEANRVNTAIGQLVIKVISVIGAIIAIVWGSLQIWKNWRL